MPKKKINSRQKGKIGELEFAHFLSDSGFEARRGQQFSGSPDSPDVICNDTNDIHWEIKRVEHLNIDDAMDQSIRDSSPEQIPVVAHRKNRKGWKVTLQAEDFLKIYKVYRDNTQEANDHD